MAGAGALLREPSGGFPSPIPSLPFLISSQPSPVLPREHKLWTQPVLGPRPGSALSSCVTSGRWSSLPSLSLWERLAVWPTPWAQSPTWCFLSSFHS